MKIVHRILLITCIPLFSFLVSNSIFIIQKRAEFSIYSEMGKNINLFHDTSLLISAIQSECREEYAFLNGASDSRLQSAREKTDRYAIPFQDSLEKAAIPDGEKTRSRNLAERLSRLRKEAVSAESVLAGYSGLTGDLLSLASQVPNAKTAKGLGKVLGGLMILATARESMNRLFMMSSSLLDKGDTLSGEEFAAVARLKAEIDVNLSSPALVVSPASLRGLKEMPQLQHWIEVDRMLSAMLMNASSGGHGVTREELTKAMSLKMGDIEGVLDKEIQELVVRMAGLDAGMSRELFNIVALSFGCVLLVAGVAAYLSVGLVRRVRVVVAALGDISHGDGDLTRRLPEGRDELGELAGYFNVFVGHLQDMMCDVRDKAATLASSAHQMSAVAGQLSSGARTAADRASDLSAAAGSMSESTVGVAASMEQAASNITSVAASTEELTSTIASVASDTERARNSTEEAAADVDSFATVLHALSSAAQEIGKVTESINSISSQTNLLALNATIEAARAGEAGKGFAVVANEIKELARQTSSATDDIRLKIDGIQTAADNAVDTVTHIVGVIRGVNGIVGSIAAAIEEQSAVTGEVAGNVAQVSSGVTECNLRAAEMAAVSRSIAGDIAGVDTVASEIQAGGTQVFESAEGLATLAEDLGRLVGRFRLEDHCLQSPAS